MNKFQQGAVSKKAEKRGTDIHGKEYHYWWCPLSEQWTASCNYYRCKKCKKIYCEVERKNVKCPWYDKESEIE